MKPITEVETCLRMLLQTRRAAAEPTNDKHAKLNHPRHVENCRRAAQMLCSRVPVDSPAVFDVEGFAVSVARTTPKETLQA